MRLILMFVIFVLSTCLGLAFLFSPDPSQYRADLSDRLREGRATIDPQYDSRIESRLQLLEELLELETAALLLLSESDTGTCVMVNCWGLEPTEVSGLAKGIAAMDQTRASEIASYWSSVLTFLSLALSTTAIAFGPVREALTRR